MRLELAETGTNVRRRRWLLLLRSRLLLVLRRRRLLRLLLPLLLVLLVLVLLLLVLLLRTSKSPLRSSMKKLGACHTSLRRPRKVSSSLDHDIMRTW